MSVRNERINEERVAIDSLVHHLRGVADGVAVTVQEESDDPPDYWLSVGSRRFAVEVTSIVTDHGYLALCNALHSSVKKQFNQRHHSGTYAIEVFRRPDLPKRQSDQWRILVGKIIACIEKMSAFPQPDEVVLVRSKRGTLAVSKWADNGSRIGLCRIPEPKWEGDVYIELKSLLNTAISQKLRKLQSFFKTCDGVILIFYDAYGYGGVAVARQAISGLGDYQWFHSIYWAESFTDRPNVLYPENPGRSGDFLYTKDKAWGQCA